MGLHSDPAPVTRGGEAFLRRTYCCGECTTTSYRCYACEMARWHLYLVGGLALVIHASGCGDREGRPPTRTIALTPTSTLGPTHTATVSLSPTPTPTRPPGGCHNAAECAQIDFCLEPGGNRGSGATPTFTPTVAECLSDSDCARFGETAICSTQTCVAGCTAETMCAVGQICAASHHCVPRPCVADGDCPQFFACDGASSSTPGGCNRRTCSTDATCPGGFCVNNRCYDQLGTCVPPPV